MASSENEPPRLELLSDGEKTRLDKPSPLRIVKRPGGIGTKRQASASTDESSESAQELSDENGPLTVMKRRGERDGVSEDGQTDDKGTAQDYSPFPSSVLGVPPFGGRAWEQILLQSQGMSVSPTLSVRKRRQKRPPVQNCIPQLPEKHRSPLLDVTSKESNDPFWQPPSGEDHSTEEQPACNSWTPRQSGSNGPRTLSYVLSPHVSVTSEVTGIYDGKCSIWAAVEVSAKLCQGFAARANADGTHAGEVKKGSFIDHQTGVSPVILDH